MSKRVKWGILSTAKIGVKQVIPAMQKCNNVEIHAIASRNLETAQEVANKLGIPKAYGSYEALLADKEIDAIYNPLPNDLHVPWTEKSIVAGKHVLCEKPLAMNAEDILPLIKLRDQYNVLAGEAFMVKCHPQWLTALDLVKKGELGDIVGFQAFFSYFNNDPKNIRNISGNGGGALYDIGCYPIFTSRLIFQEEPTRVVSLLENDPNFKTDRLGSVIMDYPSGQATFTVSTQSVPYQRIEIIGTKKRLEIRIPFNALNNKPANIFIYEGDLEEKQMVVKSLDICDQYTMQGEAFSKAILEGGEVPVTLENALSNAKVIDAIFKSSKTSQWVDID